MSQTLSWWRDSDQGSKHWQQPNHLCVKFVIYSQSILIDYNINNFIKNILIVSFYLQSTLMTTSKQKNQVPSESHPPSHPHSASSHGTQDLESLADYFSQVGTRFVVPYFW